MVNNVLGILKPGTYKGVLDPFCKGLDHFLHSTQKASLLAEVVTDMYESIEALAKIVNKNDKELSANRESLISNLKLSDYYKKMLKDYIEYANDLARHAGEKGDAKPLPSRREVESFIYLTGIFIRLAVSPEIP